MDWKRIAASVLMLGVLAVPASAASITPQTTMKEIRDDPDIKASGLYTYTYVWERDCETLSTSRDDETLTEVVGKTSAEACAAGLNYLAQVYHDGTRVTYPLYSEEEIAAKLGSPEELAAQFECTDTAKKVGGGRAVLRGAGDLPAGRMEHCRSDPRDAVLVRRDPGAQLCGAYGAARGRLRLLRGVFAAARPLLRPLPA